MKKNCFLFMTILKKEETFFNTPNVCPELLAVIYFKINSILGINVSSNYVNFTRKCINDSWKFS